MTNLPEVPTASTPIISSTPPSAFVSDKVATGHASAKFILFGEHSVVYGHPAIAMPLYSAGATATVREISGPTQLTSRYHKGLLSTAPGEMAGPVEAIAAALRHVEHTDAQLDITINADVPIGRGLGSSASVAGALVRAIATYYSVELTADEHFQLVQMAEKRAHGNPSGIDARATVATAPVWFQAGRITHLPVDFSGVFVVADTGRPASTRKSVGDVARLYQHQPQSTEALLQALGDMTFESSKDLALDRVDVLGERMFAAHECLSKLGVSNAALDQLVEVAKQAGAKGAKLTGGGQGGCIVALASDLEAAQQLAVTLATQGATNTWIHSLNA